jgi:hypothetical protein
MTTSFLWAAVPQQAAFGPMGKRAMACTYSSGRPTAAPWTSSLFSSSTKRTELISVPQASATALTMRLRMVEGSRSEASSAVTDPILLSSSTRACSRVRVF